MPRHRTVEAVKVERAIAQCGLARLEAEVLLAHTLGWRRSRLYAYPEQELTAAQQRRFGALVEQRDRGVPIAYLIGTREFWSLPLEVNRHTLIPRPETEHLVEIALAFLDGKAAPTVADLGTGSGAIALAIARERPDAAIIACERSLQTARVACGNVSGHRLGNVCVVQANWCDALRDGRFDLIVSNPPYLRTDDPHLVQGDVAFEPRAALVAGRDGLDCLRTIIRLAPSRLRPGGMLAVEHGFDQRAAVVELFTRAGGCSIQVINDAADLPRCVAGTW